MAVIKQYTTKHAVTAEYWRVDYANADYNKNRYTIQLCLYVDYQNRIDGANPILKAYCYLPLNQQEDTLTRALVYEAIKQANVFIEGRNVPALLEGATNLI